MHKLVIDAKAVLQMLFVFVLSVPVFAVNPDNVAGTQSAAVARYTPGQDFTISVAVTFTTAPGSLGIAIALDDNDGTAGWSYRSSTTGLTDEDQNPVPFPVKPSTGATAQPFNFGFIEIPNSPINMTFKFRVPNDFDDTVTIRTTVKGTSSIAGGSVPYSELLNTLTILPPVPPNVTVITPSTTFLDEDDIAVIAGSSTNSIVAGQSKPFTATVEPSTGQTLTSTFISVGKPVYVNGMWNESGANDPVSPTKLASGNLDIPFTATTPVSGNGHTFGWTMVTTETNGPRTFTWTPGAGTVTKSTPESDRIFLAQIFARQNNSGEAKAAWAVVVNPTNSDPEITNLAIGGTPGTAGTAVENGPPLTFSVNVNDADAEDTLDVVWKVDGVQRFAETINPGARTNGSSSFQWTFDYATVQHLQTSRNVAVTVEVSDRFGTGDPISTDSETFTVMITDSNRRPTFDTVESMIAITPELAFTETALTCAVSIDEASDPDGEDVAAGLKRIFTWFRNDARIQENPPTLGNTDILNANLFAEDDEIRCEVAIVDQLGLESSGLITATVTISNTAPAGADGKIIVSTGLTKQQQLVGTDDDNNDGGASDTLSFDIRKGLQANFRANLTGGSEVPAVTTTATGIGVFVLDADNDKLFYYVRYENLSSAESSAHIHGLADAGAEADPLHSLPTGNPKWGVWDYSGGAGTLDAAAIETGIQGGMMYVNIHSSDHTGGEIRGQISATTIPTNVALAVTNAGVMSFDPSTKDAAGSAMNGDFFAFTYGINDGTDNSVPKLIVLEVLDNLPPTIEGLTPSVSPNPEVEEESPLQFQATITDAADESGLEGIKSVEWLVNGNSRQFEDMDDFGAVDQWPSTFNYQPTFETIRSDDGTHDNQATFTITVRGIDSQDAEVVQSWEVTVLDNNRAPSITSVSLTVQGGGNAVEASTLMAAPVPANGLDVDNDPVTFTYKWLVNGAEVNGQTNSTLTGAHFNKGNFVVARIMPRNASRDDNQAGVEVPSNSVTILNTPPVLSESIDVTVTDGQTADEDLNDHRSDDDGDGATFQITDGVATLGTVNLASATGMFSYIADAPELVDGLSSSDTFKVRADDGDGGLSDEEDGTVVVTVTGVNDAPTADSITGLFSKTNEPDDTGTANVNESLVNSTSIELSGDDVDKIPEGNADTITFKFRTEPPVLGTFFAAGANPATATPINIANNIAFANRMLDYYPAPTERGVVVLRYMAIDNHNIESEVATIRIAVGTPPWFPFIDLLEFDEAADDGHSYRVVIRQENTEKANIAVRTSAAQGETPAKTSVDPVDYLASSSTGLIPGSYTVTVSKFVNGSFAPIGEAETLVVDDYDNAVVNVVNRNTPTDGNYDFSFDLDSVSGWQLDITRQNDNAFMRHIRKQIQPDADGVVLISGTFQANDVFLSEPGTYVWSVTPFNPKGNGTAMTGTQIVIEAPVQPTTTPSTVAVSGMSPGTSDPANPETAGVATVANGNTAVVTFEWDGVGSVDRYFVYVESLSGTIVVNAEQVPAGNTVFGPKQLPAGTYRWHVIARNALGFSTWSSPRYFKVNSDPLSNVPVIASFTRTAQILNTSVTFTVTWETQGDEIELMLFRLDTNQLFHGVVTISESSTVTITQAIAGFNPAVPDVTYRYQAIPFKNGVEGQASQLGSYLLRNAEATTQLQKLELAKVNTSLRISGLGTGSPERIKFEAFRLSLTNPAAGMVPISTTSKTVSAEMRTAGEVTVPLNEISSQLTAVGFLVSIRARVEKGGTETSPTSFGAFSESLIYLNQ